jgi:hypothetical protein
MKTPGSSLKVFYPSSVQAAGVHSTRVCLTRYVPHTGFLTLCAVYSSCRRPVLFHTGPLMGFFPFRVFTHMPAVRPSGRPSSRVVAARRIRGYSRWPTSKVLADKQADPI